MRGQCDDNGVTAEDVDARLRDHADTTGRDTEANLTWCAENSTVVCNKRLRCKPNNAAESTLDPSMLAQAEALGIDGTNKGNAIQLSRALEGQLRLFMADAQTRRAEDRARERLQMEREQMYGTMIKDAWTAAHQANLENDKLRHQQRRELDQAALQLREAVETDGAGDDETEAKTEMIKMVTGALAQALPFIVAQVQKMMVEAPPPANTNGAPP
jgi:hypothetical protein